MSRLHFIDFVRPGWWGDAALVESDGRYLLMDTCHEEGTYIIKYLKDCGVKTLDLYISHDHHDHWGRIVYFINNYKVRKVYLPVDMQGGSRARQITEAARANGTKVIYLQKGSTFTCGRWKFTVVYRRGKGDPNDRSLVVIGEGDGVRFFTAGDLSAAGEKGLLGSGADIHADIYKLSHHGDGDTNSEAVIKKGDLLSQSATATGRAAALSGHGQTKPISGSRNMPTSTLSAITGQWFWTAGMV